MPTNERSDADAATARHASELLDCCCFLLNALHQLPPVAGHPLADGDGSVRCIRRREHQRKQQQKRKEILSHPAACLPACRPIKDGKLGGQRRFNCAASTELQAALTLAAVLPGNRVLSNCAAQLDQLTSGASGSGHQLQRQRAQAQRRGHRRKHRSDPQLQRHQQRRTDLRRQRQLQTSAGGRQRRRDHRQQRRRQERRHRRRRLQQSTCELQQQHLQGQLHRQRRPQRRGNQRRA